MIRRWLRKRAARGKLDDLWCLDYDALARYNTDRGRGVQFDDYTVDRMAVLQRRYDTEYLPVLHELMEWTR